MTFAAKNLTATPTDSALLLALDHSKDSVTLNGLKMEVSPPSAASSYGSWWLTVSFPAKISAATIKLNELSTIAVPKTAVAEPGGNTAAWSAVEMEQAQTIAAQAAAVQAADAQAAAAQNAAAQAQNNNNGGGGDWNVYNTGAYVYPRAYVHDGGVYAHLAAYHPSYRR